MCVILHKKAGVTISDEDYKLAHENNPDGLGYIYVDDEGNMVKEHFLALSYDEVLLKMDELDDFDALIHFRYTTVGDTCIEQCHPFEVLPKTDEHPAIWMMHNGTFDKVPTIEGENDTMAFIRLFLAPLLRADWLNLYDQDWLDWVDDLAGWSKLAFITSDGDIIKTGSYVEREAFTTGKKYSASNSYSFTKGHRDYDYSKWGKKGWSNGYYDDYDYDDDSNYVYTPKKKDKVLELVDDVGASNYLFTYSNTETVGVLSTMCLSEITEWIISEPTEAYDILLKNAPDTLEEAVMCEKDFEGFEDDLYMWIMKHPISAAGIIKDWNV